MSSHGLCRCDVTHADVCEAQQVELRKFKKKKKPKQVHRIEQDLDPSGVCVVVRSEYTVQHYVEVPKYQMSFLNDGPYVLTTKDDASTTA